MRSPLTVVPAVAVIVALMFTFQAGAQNVGGRGQGAPENQPQPQKEPLPNQPTPQNPNLTLSPLISPDPLAPVLTPINRTGDALKQNLGLNISAHYTLLYQWATDVTAGRRDLLNGRFDLGGDWTILHLGNDTGSIGFLARSQQNIGSNQITNLGNNIGVVQGNNALENSGFYPGSIPIALNLLYWRQSFFDNKLAAYVGHLHPNQYIDLSPVANDETNQFLAFPFDGNTTDPEQGAYGSGAAVEYQATSTIHVNALILNPDEQPQTGPYTWRNGHIYEAVELGWQPKLEGLGKGYYRIDGWHDDAAHGHGYGIQVGADQEIGGGFVPFFRWGYGSPKVAGVQNEVAGGIANINPFGRRGDMFGLGISWADPSNHRLRRETLIEAFYRVQVTDSLQVSPDIQVYTPPGSHGSNNPTALFGIRLRLDF